MNKIKHYLSVMGPGLLMAGAAIGVSHIVQSTRAGANFGFQLAFIIVIANLFKYPFFEFGHRYSVATGQNLLNGYEKLGKPFLIGFFILNIFTSIGTMAGVTYVTGALAYNLFGQMGSVTMWSGILLLLCGGVLTIGHYKWLDHFMKVIMLILFVATLTAFFVAVVNGPVANKEFINPSPFNIVTLPFLIALMGWMPAPVETSVWQSLWVQAKNRNQQHNMSWQEAKLDFNFGYISTAVLALIFLALGALVMNGTGTVFSDAGGTFAAQVVNLYTQSLGAWSKPIIAFAAFFTMFSTTLTCFDAYPRSLTAAFELIWKNIKFNDRRLYYFWLLWAGLGGFLVISLFVTNLKSLVDFVTIAAFLTAPIFAAMNYKLIFSDHMPTQFRPNRWIKWLCWIGLIYLFGFSLIFLIHRFG
ncbi:MAG: Nramp family divalent metal transporter [Bdellovibrionales bacterium]|nr:Nramp family divalent metal transporter [Bdellovibrionales bacterium]